MADIKPQSIKAITALKVPAPIKVPNPEPLSNKDREEIRSILTIVLERAMPAEIKKFITAAIVFLDPKLNDNILNIDKEIKNFQKPPNASLLTSAQLKAQFEITSKKIFKENDFPPSLKLHVANANIVIQKLNNFFLEEKNYTELFNAKNKPKEADISKAKATVIKSWSEFKTAYQKTIGDLTSLYNKVKDEDKRKEFINTLMAEEAIRTIKQYNPF